MKKKKPVMILIVIIIIALLGYTLPLVFSFEANRQTDNSYQQINDQYINVLYSYLMTDNYSKIYNNYNEYYASKNNMPKQVLMAMVYNYIVTTNRFMLIELDDNEKTNGALYKISLVDFKNAYHTVFYEDDFQGVDFEYNDIKGKVKDDYMYIYQQNINPIYTTYKSIDSYALAKNGDEILIYEYYAKCDINTNLCYDDNNLTLSNNKIKNLDFTNVNNLVKYKHVFKFDKDSYYWFSSEIVKG